MKEKSKTKETQAVIVRISKEHHQQLSEMAAAEMRTMASVIRQAIKEYLARKF